MPASKAASSSFSSGFMVGVPRVGCAAPVGDLGEAEGLFVVTLKPSVLLAVSNGVAGVALGSFGVVLAAKLGCDLCFGDWSAGAGEIHSQGDVVDAVHLVGWCRLTCEPYPMRHGVQQ